MTRTERQKLKRKARTTMSVAYGCVMFFVITLVLLFIVEWRPAFFENVQTELGEMIIFLGVVLILFLPLMFGMIFNIKFSYYIRELKEEKNRLYKKQLRMYTEWLFNSIKQDNPSRAIEIHNAFIWGDTKALTRGVLMGYLFKGEDKVEMKRALKNMDAVLNEIYNPVVEKF